MAQQDEGEAQRMDALTRQGEAFLQGEVRRAREAALRGGPRQSAARWNRAVQATERPPEQREQQSRVDWLTE